MLQDLRYAFRMLWRSRGYTAVAVMALALGIGANTANFSVADAFLLKPIALPNLENLVVLVERAPNQTAAWTEASPANYLDWKRQSTSFAEVSPYEWNEVNLTGTSEPERLEIARTDPNFFEILGASAAVGHVFGRDDGGAGNQPVVLSYGLWQRRFGGDRGIVGKTVKLDGLSHVVAGVMDKKFNFPVSAEVWAPRLMGTKEGQDRGRHYLNIVARLKSGVTLKQASAEMATISRRLAGLYPETNRGWNAQVVPMKYFVTGDLTYRYTLMLVAAVMFVLMIACANVANLQFARGAARQKEFAVRTAMGAKRWRVVRQLLTESIVLSLAGAAVGLALAEWGVDLILHYMPADIARYVAGWYEIQLDGRAFAFAFGLAILSGIVSGLGPAIQSSRPDLNETLKESGRGTSAGRSRQRVRSVLVVAELALALVLLTGAGLMVTGVKSLLSMRQPYDAAHVLSIQINLPEAKYKEVAPREAFYRQSMERVRNVPGVDKAAFVRSLPYGGGQSIRPLRVEGLQAQKGEYRAVQVETISEDYFALMRIPVLEGRGIDGRDGPDALRTAVVSKSLAQRYWPGQSAIGRRIQAGDPDSSEPWLTIVGVAGEIEYDWLDREPPPVLYRSYRQRPEGWATLAIRTHGDPMRLVPAVRAAVAQVDPDQPLSEIKTLDRVMSDAVLGLSYVAVMLTILGAIALLLSAIGVSGLMAYAVTERTHEIGVRLALGAQRETVLRMLVGRGMLLAGVGLAIGFAGSVLLARMLGSLIFGVGATDWSTFAGVLGAMTIVALAASYIPARRASRLDPTMALRHE